MNESGVLGLPLTLCLGSAALAAPLAAIGARRALLHLHEAEVHWWKVLWDRLSPTPMPAASHAIAFYSTALAVALAIVLFSPSMLFAPVVLVAWPIRNSIAGVIWARRKHRIEMQLPDAIRAVAAAVDAGCTMPQAISRAAVSSPEPVATELRVMRNYYNLGADLRTTIESARARLDMSDFDLFAQATLIGRDMGGDIGTVLNRIARAIQSVHAMRTKVRAATAAGRANLKGLYVVPFVFVGLAYLADPGAVGLLMSTPLGWCLAFVSFTAIVFAVRWARRIISVDV